MNRRLATIVVAAAFAVVLVAVFVLVRRPPPGTPPASVPAPVPPMLQEAPEPWQATLWFPGQGALLLGEPLWITSGADPRSRATAVLQALLAARPEPPRAPVFPSAVAVGRLLLVEGTAYVDLRPEGGGEPPSTGSTQELLRVYSIVHTLVRNVPAVSRVVLLWNGVQRRGFPGHVDTGHALAPIPGLEESVGASSAVAPQAPDGELAEPTSAIPVPASPVPASPAPAERR